MAVAATAELMWAASCPRSDAGRVAAALAQGADLGWAAETAILQRVSGLVWRALLAAAGPSPVEAAGSRDRVWLSRLRADAQRCQAQELLLRPRLAPLLFAPLEQAGTRPLVLKGGRLASRYPAPGLRPMDDLDLLLPAEWVPRAVAALVDAGWRRHQPLSRHHETPLTHPQLPGLPVEIHHHLAIPSERSSRLTAAEVWAAREAVDVAGAPAWGVPPELELMVVATHAAKPYHAFERLIWSCDAAVVVTVAASQGRFSWQVVEDMAAKWRARTALAVALAQAARLGAGSPASLREVAAKGVRAQALEPLFDPLWPLQPRDPSVRHRLGYALIDDPLLRSRHLLAGLSEQGTLHAPAKAAELAWRAARRWRALHRAARASSGGAGVGSAS